MANVGDIPRKGYGLTNLPTQMELALDNPTNLCSHLINPASQS